MQGAAAHSARDARIVFPHDGDTFVINHIDESVAAAPAQAIVFAMQVPRGQTVAWYLNGRELAAHGDRLVWPLQPGRWHLAARSAARADAVWFKVVSAGKRMRRGFTL
jgi:hypothetical protein